MSELLYGRHPVLEALRARRRHIFRLWLEGESEAKVTGIVAEILEEANERSIPVRFIKGGLFDKLKNERVNTQGVALETGDFVYANVEDCLKLAKRREEPPFLLILDHVQDPQNFGTLIRTAEAMGVHGVIIPDRRAVHVTASVSNASSGAVEHLAVVKVVNLNRTIDELKAENIWVAGLDGAPETPPLEKANLSGAIALVVGSEGEGLSRLTREKCDFLVRIPMVGNVDSLNAAVAGSIVLYQVRRSR
ncbi:MAG: 23S rRNA (guanosine(2251)-2'-O)-methyltransferase RlmB [Caldilineaceae bacterium]